MESHKRELLVARIISGTVRIVAGEQIFVLCQPNRQQRYRAQEIYAEAYEEAVVRGLWSDDELLTFLLDEGLWDDARQEEMATAAKNIEQLKIKLFEFVYRSLERKKGKEALALTKRRYAELITERHAYDHLSCHGAAGVARVQYLVASSITYPDGRPVISDAEIWQEPELVIDQVLDAYFHSRLDETSFRELARTDPWRTYWSARQGEADVFGSPAVDLTEEQRTLTAWSQLYDNAAEHPEGPSDYVVDDDDLFDGWLLTQKRKRGDQERQNRVDGLLDNDKIKNAQEVFVPADTAEDARQVDSLNDLHAQAVKRQRLAYLQKQGRVDEQDMPDTRMELQMQRNRSMKG